MQAILTSDDVAKILHCERTTVEECMRRGELPGFKFGRTWLVPEEALSGHLNALALSEAEKRRVRAVPMAVAVQCKPKRQRPVLPQLPP